MDHNKNLFDGMVLFCAVVEQRSLTAAASHLGHTPSHVSKELARLEARMGSRLLNRTTRKHSLTETGRIYYDNARRIVSDAKVIEDRIHTLGDRPYGELKISVPVIFAQGCFNSWIPEFLDSYPDVSLNIDVSDRQVDMISESFDLVVRIGTLPNSDLIVRELFRTGMPTVAAPAYLAQRGEPKNPSELVHHDLISFSGGAATQSWTFPVPDRAPLAVEVSPKVRCNDAEMEKTLAAAGCGITRLPELACREELETGSLVRILNDYERPPAGVQLIYPNRAHLPPKTRAMADFLIRQSRQHQW